MCYCTTPLIFFYKNKWYLSIVNESKSFLNSFNKELDSEPLEELIIKYSWSIFTTLQEAEQNAWDQFKIQFNKYYMGVPIKHFPLKIIQNEQYIDLSNELIINDVNTNYENNKKYILKTVPMVDLNFPI